jgi:hypothetical protein
MFVLNSNIFIGDYQNVKPHEVKITKSVHSFVDKCIIKVPATARLKQANDSIITGSADTAKQFNEGDKVYVELGYNDELIKEFVGFVSRVNFTTPVEIECEGYSFQLRQKSYGKYFSNTPLKNILEYLIDGTDIILDPNNDVVLVKKFRIDEGTNGADVLEKLRKHLVDGISFQFTDNILYAGLDYLNRKSDVKYRLGYNVIKDNNLKLHIAKDWKVTIIGIENDGSKKTYVAVGSHVKKLSNKKTTKVTSGEGFNKVFKTHAVTDSETLKKFGDVKQKRLNYDGYEGKITCFLQPYCEPGYNALLEDKKYPERSGKYIVIGTEVTYGTSGARRIVEIGNRLRS